MIRLEIINKTNEKAGILELPATRWDWEDFLCSIELGNKIGDVFCPVPDYENKYEILDCYAEMGCVSNLRRRLTSVQEFNYVAAAMLDCNDREKIAEYMSEENYNADWDEWVNILKQEDEVEIYSYDVPSCIDDTYMSRREMYGYTLAYQTGLWDTLYEASVEDFFDFEKYGDYQSDYVTLLDSGYFEDGNIEIDWCYYTHEEIADEYSDYCLEYDYSKNSIEEIAGELTELLVG